MTTLLMLATALALAAPPAPDHGIGELLEPIRKAHDLPALAGAIVTVDGVQATAAVGVRKIGDPTPVTVDDQFHLGSCTKAMTATLIGKLVEQGKLRWNTTLAEALPDLAATMAPAYRKVTIDQLLAHRAGLTGESWVKGKTFQDMHHLPGSPMQQRRAYVAAILREPPASRPGTRFEYANRGYAILGHIAERIVGRPWETLMREWIFEPLAMKSAGFGPMGTPNKVDQPWQHVLLSGTRVPINPDPQSDNPPAIAPGGTVHCSIGDWAAFVRQHLLGERDKPGMLKAATIKRLHAPQMGGDYAGGWVVLQRDWAGGRTLMHNGSNKMNYAVVWMAPLKGFAVLVCTNQGGDEAEKASDEAASALIGWYQQHPAAVADRTTAGR